MKYLILILLLTACRGSYREPPENRANNEETMRTQMLIYHDSTNGVTCYSYTYHNLSCVK